jgi:hypothetical protein
MPLDFTLCVRLELRGSLVPSLAEELRKNPGSWWNKMKFPPFLLLCNSRLANVAPEIVDYTVARATPVPSQAGQDGGACRTK